jgi:hypothetical protein
MRKHAIYYFFSVLELFQRWLPFKLNWKLAAKSYLDLGYLGNTLINNDSSVVDVDEIVDKLTKFYLGNKPPIVGTQFEFGEVNKKSIFYYKDQKLILLVS